MTKYLAMAAGLAMTAATTFSYAQTPTPPSTDRPSGLEEGAASGKADMDKKKGTMNKSAPKAGATTMPSQSTDSPSGVEEGGASAKKNPDRK